MSNAAQVVLRLGVAFAFLFPPLDAFFDPNSWLGYFPPFLFSLGIPDLVLLHGFGVVEIIVALWLLSGWKIFWPSLAAAAMLISIVLLNLPQFEILFRDLAIAAAALALALDARRKDAASGTPA